MGGRGGLSGFSAKNPAPKQKRLRNASEAQDIDELRDYMNTNYHLRVSKTLDSVDFTEVRDIAQNAEDFIREFPQAAASIRRLEAQKKKKNVFASASFFGGVTINSSLYKNPSGIAQSYDSSVKSHFHPKGTTYKNITDHEFGHLLERALIQKDTSLSGPAKAYAWNKCTKASAVISEAIKAVKQTPGGKGRLTNDIIKHTSDYAMKNRSEALAECVADYRANGANARQLSKEVWKILKMELG